MRRCKVRLKRLCRFLRKCVLPQLTITTSFSPTSGQAGTTATLTVGAMLGATPVPDGTPVSVLGTASDGTTTTTLTGTTTAGIATMTWTAVTPAGLWSFVPTVQGETGPAATFKRSIVSLLKFSLIWNERPLNFSSLW